MPIHRILPMTMLRFGASGRQTFGSGFSLKFKKTKLSKNPQIYLGVLEQSSLQKLSELKWCLHATSNYSEHLHALNIFYHMCNVCYMAPTTSFGIFLKSFFSSDSSPAPRVPDFGTKHFTITTFLCLCSVEFNSIAWRLVIQWQYNVVGRHN